MVLICVLSVKISYLNYEPTFMDFEQEKNKALGQCYSRPVLVKPNSQLVLKIISLN